MVKPIKSKRVDCLQETNNSSDAMGLSRLYNHFHPLFLAIAGGHHCFNKSHSSNSIISSWKIQVSRVR
jgi:hypothetical protein